MNEYDVIVVGAGNGGLTAACTLAKNGFKTLLLEKHNVPGGCATSFRRGRFEFEVALHQLSGLGKDDSPGPLRWLLNEIGVLDQLEWFEMREMCRVWLPGQLDITLEASFEKAAASLKERFPEEEKAIDAFLGLMDRYYEESVQIFSGKDSEPSSEKYPVYFKYALKTAQQVLDEFFRDPLIKLAFSAYWSFLGLPPSKLPFSELAYLMALYFRYKPYHLRGGSQALSNAIYRRFLEYGGEGRLSCEVQRILVEDGCVLGVLTSEGQEFRAGKVICNASPVSVYGRLMEPGTVPPEEMARWQAKSLGQSIFGLYIGLDCDPEVVGIKNATNFIFASQNLEEEYLRTCFLDTENDPLMITCYNLVNPDFSPPGTSLVTVLDLKYGEPWLNVPTDRYHETKNLMAAKILDRVEKLHPGFREHIEEMEIATPITYMRYLGTPGGCVYGFEKTLHDSPLFSKNKGSLVKGLYFVGGWMGNGAGFQPTLMSGWNVASSIMREEKDGAQEKKRTLNEATKRLIESYNSIEKEVAARQKKHRLDFSEIEKRCSQYLERIHPQEVSLVVEDKIIKSDSVATLRLKPLGRLFPPFQAGQHINLFLHLEGLRTQRPYTISSPPSEREHIEITVKRVEGGLVSNYLIDQLRPGDKVVSSGPQGNFYYQPLLHGTNLVFIAGGIGITPFVSMVREFSFQKEVLDICLIYACRTMDDAVFHEELKNLSQCEPGFSYLLVISEPDASYHGYTGFVDAQLIQRLGINPQVSTFFISGPAEMHDFCVSELKKLGVSRRRIKQNISGGWRDISVHPDWPREFTGDELFELRLSSGPKVLARAKEPIISALERAGIGVKSACRSGECSMCRVRLLAGRVFQPSEALLRESDAANGYIHCCSAYPLSDLLIDL